MERREFLNVKAQVIGWMMEWAIAKGGMNLKLVPLLEALIEAFDSVEEAEDNG